MHPTMNLSRLRRGLRLVAEAAAVTIGAVIALPGQVHAAPITLTWTGSGGEGGLWSDTGNWSPSLAPTTGDSLVFPASSSSLLTTDDIPGLSIASITMATAYQLYGQDLTMTGPFAVAPGSGEVVIANNLILGADVRLTNGDTSNALMDLGNISESGGAHMLTVAGAGKVDFLGNETYTGGTTIDGATTGYALMDGPASTADVTVPAGATLGGHGTAGNVGATGGTVAPGNSPGHLTVASLGFTSSSTYDVELNGTTSGSQYDQTTSNGAVTLGSATLSITFGYTPAVGDSFKIIDKASAGATSGTFAGLSEGREFLSSGHILRISYAGGDGNDTVLTVLNAFSSTTTLASSKNPSTLGDQVTFSAHVDATNSAGTPTGSVTFKDGASVLATVALDGSNNATFTTTGLGAGNHSITVTYPGDSSFNGSTAALTQVVSLPVPTAGVGASPTLPWGGALMLFGGTLLAAGRARRRRGA